MIKIIGFGGIGGYLGFKFSEHSISYSVINPSKKEESIDILINNRKHSFTPNYEIENDCSILFIALKHKCIKLRKNEILQNSSNSTLIVPLLNGMEHYKELKTLDRIIIPANIGGINSSKINPNLIECYIQNVHINLQDTNTPLFFDLIKALTTIGIKVNLFKTKNEVIWEKLSRLAVISAATAFFNKSLGEILKDSTKNNLLINLTKEMDNVCMALFGTNIYEKLEDNIKSLPENLTTSLQRDIAIGEIGELNQIVGSVLNTAKELDLEIPNFLEVYKNLKTRI